MALFEATFNKKSKYFHSEGVVHYNRMSLDAKQAYCNDRLRVRGHLFLNEVHDLLDIPRTRHGQFAGWVRQKFQTDSFVSFGIEKITTEEVLLTFNCRPDILDVVFGSTT